jgi:hypothetical protein
MRSKFVFTYPLGTNSRNALRSIYYQHNPDRISACPITIHALLHIADSIKAVGPVWCYWTFPMERYCGTLKPAIRSRRFPYASLDRFITESAELTHIKVTYNLSEELSLQPPCGRIAGTFSDPGCESLSLWVSLVCNYILLQRSNLCTPSPKRPEHLIRCITQWHCCWPCYAV